MLFDILRTASTEEMLEKFAVKELIEFERFCRDNALWDRMRECFAEDSYVNMSWYKGNGRGFVQQSSEMKAKAVHRLNNTLVWVNGARAVAVCMASIQTRKQFIQAEMDLITNIKMIYRAIKDASKHWKISQLDVIYEKDSLVPAYPADREPDNRFRKSYANLSRLLAEEGFEIDSDLPGEDRPELIERLLGKAHSWLN